MLELLLTAMEDVEQIEMELVHTVMDRSVVNFPIKLVVRIRTGERMLCASIEA